MEAKERPLVFQRTITKTVAGQYRCAIPAAIGRMLSKKVGIVWDGKGAIIRDWSVED